MATLRSIKHPLTKEVLDKGIVLWFPGIKSNILLKIFKIVYFKDPEALLVKILVNCMYMAAWQS